MSQVDYVLGKDGYEMRRGTPETLRGVAHAAEVEYDDLVLRIEEGNENYRVTRDRFDTRHETVLFNGNRAGNALILKPSTTFSSALKNPGNFLETALAATLNPDAAYMYWGAYNYPSGHLRPADRTYVRQTGRYTHGDGSDQDPYRAVDSIKDVVDMFARQERVPTHFVADQEAGRLVLPIMVEIGTTRGAYLNGIDGISPRASYAKASFMEDVQSRIRRRRMGDGQPGELTPVNIKDVKHRVPTIYTGLGRIAHLPIVPLVLFPRDDAAKVNLMVAYSRHNDLDDLVDHAVYQDMSAALQGTDVPAEAEQPLITMQFNRESTQHDLEDCFRYGQLVMGSIPAGMRSPGRSVRILVGDGTWTQNTDAPYDSSRMQRLGLPDIRHHLMLAGGRALDSQIFELPALGEEAA